jgi:hypothetical protein
MIYCFCIGADRPGDKCLCFGEASSIDKKEPKMSHHPHHDREHVECSAKGERPAHEQRCCPNPAICPRYQAGFNAGMTEGWRVGEAEGHREQRQADRADLERLEKQVGYAFDNGHKAGIKSGLAAARCQVEEAICRARKDCGGIDEEILRGMLFGTKGSLDR